MVQDALEKIKKDRDGEKHLREEYNSNIKTGVSVDEIKNEVNEKLANGGKKKKRGMAERFAEKLKEEEK